ncbi:MAG TPA: hypothetical protein VHM64_07170 [Candidatus Binatia bacterium]|nr:hypothetical protein [Candidatus Binatia bacterium]
MVSPIDYTGNIGAAEQRKRLIFGVLAGVAAIAWIVTGRATSFSGALVLFFFFWFSALGILQAKRKT